MKKTITNFVLGLMFSSALIMPQLSSAGIGYLVNSQRATTVGGVMALGGGVGFVGSLGYGFLADSFAAAYIAGGLADLGLIGLIILDDQSQSAIHYQELSEKDGLKIGLSHSELVAYNANIEAFNAIADEISFQGGDALTVEMAGKRWSESVEQLGISKAAVNGLVKVTGQLFKRS